MSLIFVATASVLTVIAVLTVVLTMMRTPSNTAADRKQSNILVARQRIEELERQHKEGQLSDTDANVLRKEIEKELLTDIEDDVVVEEVQASSSGRKKNRIGIFFVAILIPLTSGAMYLLLGEPGAITQTTQITSALDESSLEDFNLEEVTIQLQERVKQEPENQRAWFVLATSLILQERFAEGAEAYAKLRELAGDTVDLLVREADARGMARGGILAGEPETLIRQALQLDPNHMLALWLGGLAASEQGNHAEALKLWDRAQEVVEDPEARVELMRLMEESQRQIDSTELVSEYSPVAVQVMVALSPTVAAGIDPEATVFVLARAVDGPPAPLAVVRLQVKDLPLNITLDDSMAMMPNLQLSDFESVVVVARVSKTGQPRASSGDVFGQSDPITPGSDLKVDIVIDTIVP